MSDSLIDDCSEDRHVRHAADWFFFVVGATIIVLIFGYMGYSDLPAFGLVTPLLLAGGAPGSVPVSLAMIAAMCALLLAFIAIGVKAAEGSRAALTLGLILYVVDTGLMLGKFDANSTKLQVYGGLGWHFITLVAICQGFLGGRRSGDMADDDASSASLPNKDTPAPNDDGFAQTADRPPAFECPNVAPSELPSLHESATPDDEALSDSSAQETAYDVQPHSN